MVINRVDIAEKVISAPAERVFQALTEQDAVAEWLPPDGATGEIHQFEARPGGLFRMTLHFAEGVAGKTTKDSDTISSRFVRIVLNSLVDQAIEFDSEDPAFSGTMRMLWSLETENETSTQVRVEAHNVPKGIDPVDHAKGLRSSLENLATWCESHLAEQ